MGRATRLRTSHVVVCCILVFAEAATVVVPCCAVSNIISAVNARNPTDTLVLTTGIYTGCQVISWTGNLTLDGAGSSINCGNVLPGGTLFRGNHTTPSDTSLLQNITVFNLTTTSFTAVNFSGAASGGVSGGSLTLANMNFTRTAIALAARALYTANVVICDTTFTSCSTGSSLISATNVSLTFLRGSFSGCTTNTLINVASAASLIHNVFYMNDSLVATSRGSSGYQVVCSCVNVVVARVNFQGFSSDGAVLISGVPDFGTLDTITVSGFRGTCAPIASCNGVALTHCSVINSLFTGNSLSSGECTVLSGAMLATDNSTFTNNTGGFAGSGTHYSTLINTPCGTLNNSYLAGNQFGMIWYSMDYNGVGVYYGNTFENNVVSSNLWWVGSSLLVNNVLRNNTMLGGNTMITTVSFKRIGFISNVFVANTGGYLLAYDILNSAVMISNLTCIGNHATIVSNTANGNSYVISSSTFIGNFGTVIDISGVAGVAISNSIFQGNSATNGGALNVHDTAGASVTSVTFVANTASQSGGAILLERSASLNIAACTFSNNTATIGGAIFLDLAVLSGSGSLLSGNSASQQGGAVVVGSGGSMSITGWNFTDNRAQTGAAIYASSSYTVSRCWFTGNSALLDGGAIYGAAPTTISDCVFKSNAGQNGGALNQNVGSFTLSNSTFTSNIGTNGGALYGIASASGSLRNLTFLRNTASQMGGALFWQAINPLSLTGSNAFTSNTAPAGGAVRVSTVSTISFTGTCSFVNNSASGCGGAVSVAAQGLFSITNGTFQNNTASQGGAICTVSPSTLTLRRSIFVTNIASGNGGAVNADGSASLVNTNFTSNIAANGGGMHTTADATFSRVFFTANSASLEGGAIRGQGGSLLFTGINAVLGNLATRGAGVACVRCAFNTSGGTFSNNTASQSGAALWCDPARATTTPVANVSGTVFVNNYAGWEPALEANCTACGCCDYGATVIITPTVRCSMFRGYGNCSYTCGTGYNVSTDYKGRFACPPLGSQDWIPLAICPAIPCDPLPPPMFGNVSQALNPVTTNVANYSCDDGYYFDPLATMRPTCVGPHWIAPGNPPACLPLACPLLSALAHGNQTGLSGAQGASVTFNCNNGYFFSNGEGPLFTITCDKGAWSAQQPSCLPGACPELAQPVNGQGVAVCRNTDCIGHYSCNPGYNANASTILCTSPAWNGTKPDCYPTPCPVLSAPVRGTVNPDRGVTGDSVQFSCHTGFAIQGPPQLKCFGPTWQTIYGTIPLVNTTCVSVSCAAFAAHQNTSDACMVRMQYGQRCDLVCLPGYEGPAYSTVCEQSSSDPTQVEGVIVYSTAQTPAPCSPCDKGRYSEDGRKCLDCINAFTDNATSTSQTDCLCREGYYEEVPYSGICIACPYGGLCRGRRAQPVAGAGFFYSGGTYVTCTPALACLPENVCAAGYRGYSCGLCADDYYKFGGFCLPCPHPGYWKVLVAALGAGIALLVFIPLSRPSARAEHSMEFGSVTIILNFVQITALFVDIRLPWPSLIRSVMDVFSSLNLNVELMNPECAAKLSFYDKYILQLMLPVGVLAWFAAVAGVTVLVQYILHRHTSYPWKSYAKNVAENTAGGYLLFLSLAYILVCRATLSLFSCKQQADGVYVLALSPGDACYSPQWHAYIPLAVFAILIYIIGVPCVFLGSLLRMRQKYGTRAAAVNQPTAFYVKKYSYWYWELVIMMRKVLVVFITLFLVDSLISAVVLISAVLFANIIATGVLRPYKWDGHDLVDFAGLLGCLAVLFSGLVVNSPTFTAVAVADGLAILVVIVVLIICVACFIYEVVVSARLALDTRSIHTAKHALPGGGVSVVSLAAGEQDLAVVYSNGAISRHNLTDLGKSNEESLHAHKEVRTVARIGSVLAILDTANHLHIKYLDSGRMEPILEARTFAAVTVHGSMLAAATTDGHVTVWRVVPDATGNPTVAVIWAQSLAIPVARDGLALSPTSVVLCTSADPTLGAEIIQLGITNGVVFGRWRIPAANVAQDRVDKLHLVGNHVILATAKGGIFSLELETGVWLALSLHTNAVTALADWHEYLFSASLDGSVRAWNTEGLCVFTIRANLVGFTAMAILRDTLYVGLEDGSVMVHSLAPAEKTLKLLNTSSTFSPLRTLWRKLPCPWRKRHAADNEEAFGRLLASPEILELELQADTRDLKLASTASQLQALAVLTEYTQNKT